MFIYFSIVCISGSISLIIQEEHGIHCMPCSSRITSWLATQICYHSSYGNTNWRAKYLVRNIISWTSLRQQYGVIAVAVT